MYKVLVVTNAATGGGAEISMSIIINQMVNHNFKVSRVDMRDSKSELTNNLNTTSLNLPKRLSFFDLLKPIFNFYKQVKTGNFDFAIINCELPEIFALFIPKKTTIVVVEHAVISWNNHNFIGYIVRKLLIMKKAVWVKVSESINIRYAQSQNSIKIANPIDFFYLEKNLSKTNAEILKRIVFIGRFEEVKNPKVFIDLCSKLNLCGLMIGSGKLKSICMNYANAKGVSISFKNFINNPWTEIKDGDLIIIPSVSEGDGRVLAEAAIRNLPLMVSDIPSFREYKLPEKSYIKNFNLIEINNISNLSDYRIGWERAVELMNNRSPSSVFKLWQNLFRSIK